MARQNLVRLKNSELDTLIALLKKSKYNKLKRKLLNYRIKPTKEQEVEEEISLAHRLINSKVKIKNKAKFNVLNCDWLAITPSKTKSNDGLETIKVIFKLHPIDGGTVILSVYHFQSELVPENITKIKPSGYSDSFFHVLNFNNAVNTPTFFCDENELMSVTYEVMK